MNQIIKKQSPRNDFFGFFQEMVSEGLREFTDTTLGTMSYGLNYERNESDGSLLVSVDVPGMKEADIAIELVDGFLSVKGEKKSNNNYRSVNKSFSIPQGFDEDSIQAKLEDGVLLITLKTKELSPPPQAEVKKISISS
jgi:HSP20 family molecular chaperone IbpA